jgi:hypothetical protein
MKYPINTPTHINELLPPFFQIKLCPSMNKINILGKQNITQIINVIEELAINKDSPEILPFLYLQKEKSVSKPYLSKFSNFSEYTQNRRMVYYTQRNNSNTLWVKGKVLTRHRYHEGIVSFINKHYHIHSRRYLGGYGAFIGVVQPEVLLRWEYDFFTKTHNHTFKKIWKANLPRSFRNSNKSHYLSDLHIDS